MDKIIESIKRVVLYLRLSDEDHNKLSKEELSESIKNQERMLRDYANSHNWQITHIYNDEDYSGIDSNRPEFNKMIKECELGNVDIVLCKTQSRFTRDMELVEKYLHNKFNERNVRFISIVDNADTDNKGNKKSRQINGLVNEWYLEDTSDNIKAAYRSKRIDGQFTGSFASYGYMKDPKNKNHLIIDEVVADNVRKIFKMYISNYGISKIIKTLTEENIVSPLEYKFMNGSKIMTPLLYKHRSHEFILKSGTYRIINTYFNNERQILKNLTSINVLTSDSEFTDKLDIKLIDVSDELDIYYSLTKITDADIDFNNLIKINKNEYFPKGIKAIITYSKELDRLHQISYELEVTLKQNKELIKYFYNTKTITNNIDVDINFKQEIRNRFKWSEQTIKRILKNEIYIGTLAQFKTTTVSYKNKKVIQNDKKDWIIVENTHEAIISKEDWLLAQDRINNRRKTTKNGQAHVLVNKLYCDYCKKVFFRRGYYKNDGSYSGYMSCKEFKNHWLNCDNKKYVREYEIHKIIIDEMNKLLDKYYDEKLLDNNLNNLIDSNLYKDKIDNLKLEKQNILKELNNKNSYFGKLYEDRLSGIITTEEYIALRNKYREDTDKLNNRITIIDNELDNIYLKQEQFKDKHQLLQKYRHITELTPKLVREFIDKVYIGVFDETNNTRPIRIVWNFLNTV